MMSSHTHAATYVEDPTLRRQFGRRAQLLAAASVSYNLIEAVAAITAGLVAGSIALVGFGLDSIVEVSSGLIILWLTPLMSWNVLALALGLTAYILIGIHFEERKLLAEFGQAYADYQRRTPALLPRRGAK